MTVLVLEMKPFALHLFEIPTCPNPAGVLSVADFRRPSRLLYGILEVAGAGRVPLVNVPPWYLPSQVARPALWHCEHCSMTSPSLNAQ